MRRSKLAAAAAAATALAALALPRAAAAYCRTSVCPDVGTSSVCTPPQGGDCGTPLFWPTPCVSFSIQLDASTQVSLADTMEIFETAFAAWTGADCGGGTHPRIRINSTPPVLCDAHEYNQDRGNANIIVYRDAGWPHPGSNSTLALTTVTYNVDNGEIYDADMELNSHDIKFSIGDEAVTFDLLSIATHETGHFLGLSHSADAEATMFAIYTEGSTGLRDLSPDDIAGICAIYPPGEPIEGCDATPRHGFSIACAEEQGDPTGGCAAAARGEDAGARGGAALSALALLGAAAALRARRRGGPARQRRGVARETRR